MSTMIQIRNVPENLHRAAKSRAALAGMSMSDYLLAEIRRAVARPTREDLIARIAELPPVNLDTPPAEVIRSVRDRS